MKAKKGLQKFIEAEIKINEILSLQQITPKDLEPLTRQEHERFAEIINERANKLKGEERDNFYNKIEPITSQATKNQLLENNHTQITWAITNLMQEYGRMPSKTEIATKTLLAVRQYISTLKNTQTIPSI